jgi:hypothetical protein
MDFGVDMDGNGWLAGENYMCTEEWEHAMMY